MVPNVLNAHFHHLHYYESSCKNYQFGKSFQFSNLFTLSAVSLSFVRILLEDRREPFLWVAERLHLICLYTPLSSCMCIVWSSSVPYIKPLFSSQRQFNVSFSFSQRFCLLREDAFLWWPQCPSYLALLCCLRDQLYTGTVSRSLLSKLYFVPKEL